MELYSRFFELGNEGKVLVLAAITAVIITLGYGIKWLLPNRHMTSLPILGKKITVAKKIAAFKKVFATIEKMVRRLMSQRDKLEAQVTEMTAANAQDAAEIEKLITAGEALIAELDAKP
jgi:hypothetical protein